MTTAIKRLAWACTGGAAAFVISGVLMHVVQPDLSPVDIAVSYYMNGRLGWLLGLGLFLMGAGSLCLFESLRRLGVSAAAPTGKWALALWAAGAMIGGVFPPDPPGHWDEPMSIPGALHAYAAMAAFLAFPVASVSLSARIRTVAGEAYVGAWLKPLAIAGAALLVAFFFCLMPAFANRPPYALGLVERILLLAMAGWLIAAGLAVQASSHRR